MGRPRRTSLGGYLHHVLNRGNGRLPVFFKECDYEAFLHVVVQTQEHVPGMRLLAHCLLPNSLRQCVERDQPYEGEPWGKHAAGKLGLASTLRPRGRPRKAEKKGS